MDGGRRRNSETAAANEMSAAWNTLVKMCLELRNSISMRRETELGNRRENVRSAFKDNLDGG